MITVVRGDVFDVNYQSPQWVVATQAPAESGDELADDEEDDAALSASHLHRALIVATPVHDASEFVERKARLHAPRASAATPAEH